ncbi:MAG: hypothetical protein V1885_03195 [Candidatus Brennerbacteria bacterium]
MKSTFKHVAGSLSQFFIDLVNEVQEELGEAGDEAIERAFKSKKFMKETAKLIVAGANGAKKLTLKSLKPLTDGIEIAAELFAKDSFWKQNGPVKLYFWDNFTSWILSAMPETIPAFHGTLAKFELTRSMYDSEILSELGQPIPFTIGEFAALIRDLLTKQPKGEDGLLLANGYVNIFYVKLDDKRVVAVDVCWGSDDRRWRCYARALGARGRWSDGYCVFSRS